MRHRPCRRARNRASNEDRDIVRDGGEGDLLAGMPVTGRKGLIFTYDGERPLKGWSHLKAQFDQLVLAELRRVAGERRDLAMLERLDEIARLLATCANRKASEAERKAARVKLKELWWAIHDLRRTARTLMTKGRVDPDHAERALGHVIPGVRGTYDLHKFEGREAPRLRGVGRAGPVHRVAATGKGRGA